VARKGKKENAHKVL